MTLARGYISKKIFGITFPHNGQFSKINISKWAWKPQENNKIESKNVNNTHRLLDLGQKGSVRH